MPSSFIKTINIRTRHTLSWTKSPWTYSPHNYEVDSAMGHEAKLPDHRKAFGQRVKHYRLKPWQGSSNPIRSQEDFARHIGVDRTYISGIERGVRNPTLDMIIKIAAGLGVPAQYLLEGISEPESKRSSTETLGSKRI